MTLNFKKVLSFTQNSKRLKIECKTYNNVMFFHPQTKPDYSN